MKLVIRKLPVVFYLAKALSSGDDIIEISCKDAEKNKARWIIKCLMENFWEYDSKYKDEKFNSIVYIVKKTDAKKKKEKQLKKNKLIKEYLKNPYSIEEESQILCGIEKWAINLLSKYKKVEKEDFNYVILRMHETIEALKNGNNKRD